MGAECPIPRTKPNSPRCLVTSGPGAVTSRVPAAGGSGVPWLASERELVLRKTDGRCHICGGPVSADWQADHVLAYSAGGAHNPDNYLPARSLYNNYRWDYLPAEFEYILKLGVWAKTQIKRRSSLGKSMAGAFLRHESSRRKRRRTKVTV